MARICPDCEVNDFFPKLENKQDVLSQDEYLHCWVCNEYFPKVDIKKHSSPRNE